MSKLLQNSIIKSHFLTRRNCRGLNLLSRCAGFYKTFFMLVLMCSAPQALSGDYFRFGTGGSGGTYLPIGSLIADAINKRKLITPVNKELVVLPQRSNGSIANLFDISDSLLEAGLAQADTVSHVYQGNTRVAEETARRNLRLVGSLYLESVHFVVSTASGINDVSELVDKRVSVDELGSGTQIDVESLLAAYGLSRDDMKTIYLKPNDSIDRMRRGMLDAFFVIAGYPLGDVKKLVDDGVGRVVAFKPDIVSQLASDYLYLSSHTIPVGVYANESTIPTLGVSAQMVVRADVDAETVYLITETLWREDTLRAFRQGHPRGVDIKAETALQGAGIPFHEGALKYYREQGYTFD